MLKLELYPDWAERTRKAVIILKIAHKAWIRWSLSCIGPHPDGASPKAKLKHPAASTVIRVFPFAYQT